LNTRVWGTIIDVFTHVVDGNVTVKTITGIKTQSINTSSKVATSLRVVRVITVIKVHATLGAYVTNSTHTGITIDLVETRTTIFARVSCTIINVLIAGCTSITSITFTSVCSNAIYTSTIDASVTHTIIIIGLALRA
jgi:hypothetical protein